MKSRAASLAFFTIRRGPPMYEAEFRALMNVLKTSGEPVASASIAAAALAARSGGEALFGGTDCARVMPLSASIAMARVTAGAEEARHPGES